MSKHEGRALVEMKEALEKLKEIISDKEQNKTVGGLS
jgi:hypothetical protein